MSSQAKKEILDSIWGDESGVMLVVQSVEDGRGVELSIGFPPGDIRAHVTLAPYRVKRLIGILQKIIGDVKL